MTGSGDDRSVKAGDITGSVIITGDHNRVEGTAITVALPAPGSVDVAAEIAGLRAVLAALDAPDAGKLDRALQDAEEEAAKPAPDKDEIGGAIERALRYAKAADEFSGHAEKLAPRIAGLAAWLGENWTGLLALIGVGIAA